MSDTILSGDFSVFYAAENNQKRIKWTGSSTGTRTARQLYSALQDLFDEPAQMDDVVPMRADTPDIYRIINQWFIDDDSVEHLTGGSLYSDKWKDGTTEHVLLIGYGQTTEFNAADIGRTIRGRTTTDTGTILDFNATRKLLWIRPDDPLASGDEFDNGAETYDIGSVTTDVSNQVGNNVAEAWRNDNGTRVSQATACNNDTDADVNLFPAVPEANNDSFEIGFAQKFSRVKFNRVGSAAGVGGSASVYEYSKGSGTWGTLTGVTDQTAASSIFCNAAVADNESLTFTVPADWVTDTLGGSAQLYWIRIRQGSTAQTTTPTASRVLIAGSGEGAFANHNRHGVASKAGESGWVGIATIGTIEPNTHVYIGREDPDLIAADSREALVVATKGSSDWWTDGPLNIVLKVKEADNIFGQLPGATTAAATVLARQYSKTYSHFVASSLATAGGNTVVPLSTADDLDNTTGTRNLVWAAGSSSTLLDEELLYNVGTTTVGNFDAGVQLDATGEDAGVFTNDTTDLNDIGGTDVSVWPDPEAVDDAFCFGKDNPFNFLLLDVATNGVCGTNNSAQWQYYNGSAWVPLTGLVDDTNTSTERPLTAGTGRRLVTWTIPSDWARKAVTNQPATAPSKLFYVRVEVLAANYTTVPVLHQGWCAGEVQLKARIADTTITTPAGATGDSNYYLVGDPIVDFASLDVVVAATSRKTFDINGAPTNAGPAAAADDNITVAHAQFLRDIDEDGTTDPYSINIANTDIRSASRIYEKLKFFTRRGATLTTSTDGQLGQFYLGNELQVEYAADTAFAEGSRVYDQTSDAEGIVVAHHAEGTGGDVILRVVRGTFTNASILSDSPDPTYVMNTSSKCYAVDVSVPSIVDESADALSGAAADVVIFVGTEEVGVDYFAIGATKPFAKVIFNNVGGTAGTVGVVLWEYWNGTSWQSLESGFNLVDGTSDFTAAAADGQNLTFTPPINWRPRGLSDGTVNSPTLFFLRARVTTAYTVNPVYDDIQVEDDLTATISGTPRTVPTVAAAPFGTFPGASKIFFASGAAPTPAQMAVGEEQKFSTIDDNGVTRNPPNKQSMSVTNLISGDTVTVFRRTALVINKTQFVLAASNDRGDTAVIMNATIPADNPAATTTLNQKVRVSSGSGQEHRYRYKSFATTTFQLLNSTDQALYAGTADAGSTNTTLVRAGQDFLAALVEVGDYVRQTAGSLLFSRVMAVTATTLTVSDNGETWSSKAYSVNSLVEDYASGQNAYVPLVERIASATSHSSTLTFSTNIDVRIDVRRNIATAILPFTQDATFVSTGLSIAAARNPDEITT